MAVCGIADGPGIGALDDFSHSIDCRCHSQGLFLDSHDSGVGEGTGIGWVKLTVKGCGVDYVDECVGAKNIIVVQGRRFILAPGVLLIVGAHGDIEP